jgi:sugar/nucleoside kinase (ribokinase family)
METLYTTKRNQSNIAPPGGAAALAVIGELNVDLLVTGLSDMPKFGCETLAAAFETVLGSASAIFASGVAQLGHTVNFYSRVGDDDFGRFCLRALEERGIATGKIAVSGASRTGVTISLSTPSDRALVTFLGAIAELSYDDLPKNALDGSSHLHLTSYFLQHQLRPSFVRLFREARQRGMTTSFDPNSDPSEAWTSEIWDVVREADIFLVNESEALALTGEASAEAAAARLATEVPCPVIKLGSRGAIGVAGREIVKVPSFPISPLDTTGAGDSFAAGFVHAYLSGGDLESCLLTGNACGAMSALKAGGTAGQPNTSELAAFLAQHPCGRSTNERKGGA